MNQEQQRTHLQNLVLKKADEIKYSISREEPLTDAELKILEGIVEVLLETIKVMRRNLDN